MEGHNQEKSINPCGKAQKKVIKVTQQLQKRLKNQYKLAANAASHGFISFQTKTENNHRGHNCRHEVQMLLESPKYPTLLLLCPDSDVLMTKVKKTKTL